MVKDIIDRLNANRTPSLRAGVSMLHQFTNALKYYEGQNKKATEIFNIAKSIGLKSSPLVFADIYFMTPSVFFKNLDAYKAERKRITAPRVKPTDDNYTGDWDDRMHIDKVERIIKSRKPRNYF
jgi:hypothetical protein